MLPIGVARRSLCFETYQFQTAKSRISYVTVFPTCIEFRSIMNELFDDPQALGACAPLSEHTSWGSFTLGVLEAIHGVAHARVPAEAGNASLPGTNRAASAATTASASFAASVRVGKGRRPDRRALAIAKMLSASGWSIRIVSLCFMMFLLVVSVRCDAPANGAVR